MVVDLDVDDDGKLPDWPPAGRELPAGCVVGTPSGGRHHYCRFVDGVGNSAGKLTEHVDVRAEGGYVVVPPSRSPKGAYQLLLGDFGMAQQTPCPDWLAETLRRPPRTRRPSSAATGDAQPIPEGQRNSTLTSLAGTMRQRGMTTSAIRAALAEENATRCTPPLGDEEVNRIAHSIGQYPSASLDDKLVTLRLTDAGNGEAIALLYCDTLRYDHKRGRWLLWRSHWWEPDEDGEVWRLAKLAARQRYIAAAHINDTKHKEAVSTWAIKSESRGKLTAALAQARTSGGRN